MNNKKDPNKKHYFETATHDEFSQSLIGHCQMDTAQLLTIWEKGEAEDLSELYQATSYDPQTKTITMLPQGSLISKLAGSAKASKQVLIKIPIENKIHYFTGGLLIFHPNNSTYTLQIQQPIYKSQQRKTYRLKASHVISIQFKIDEQVYDGIDISVGGTSFHITSNDAERFKKDLIFENCTLRFNRTNYYIPRVKIAGHFPPEYNDDAFKNKIKVGVTFLGLSQKVEDALYIKISTEARGEEMNNKFTEILSKKGPDQ